MAAYLLCRSSGQTVTLVAHTRIGRAKENHLVLSDLRVSALHAGLVWNERGQWELRDLGSVNGTYVNGTRLSEGERRILRSGTRLGFGDPALEWCMKDEGPPVACARHLGSGQLIWSEKQLLSLHTANGEEAQVYEDRHGDWIAEVVGEPRHVRDGELIRVGTETFELSLPTALVATQENPDDAPHTPLADLRFLFIVSADQEHVLMRVLQDGKEVWSSDRAFTHALLDLARARLADRANGIAEAEQGWVYADLVCKNLCFPDMGRLNVEIYRARTELSRAGIVAAACIVERRRGSGQLRIGTGALEIINSQALQD